MPVSGDFRYEQKGMRVPYPANYEPGRTNAGYIDLRGRPDRVDEIHEASRSPALARLLREIASGEDWITLGCDLGAHVEQGGSGKVHVAGGYLQLTTAELTSLPDVFEKAGERIFRYLEDAVQDDSWQTFFEISPIEFRLVGKDPCTGGSLKVSFFAEASVPRRARASRERLISGIRLGLLSD